MNNPTNRYWGQIKEISASPQPDILPKEPSYLESVDNRIYFYSEIQRSKILQLNRKIRELNNHFYNQKILLSLKEDIPLFLHIDSNGGCLFSGLSAMDTILGSRIPITTIVEGCCASSATLLSIVGKERYISEHSFMLIHQLSSGCWGKYSELKDNIENLDKFMNMIRSIYLKYTKIPTDILDGMLEHDIWFDAEKCLTYGLVDKII
jgi:ATP-dependent Clp protease protease subunit